MTFNETPVLSGRTRAKLATGMLCFSLLLGIGSTWFIWTFPSVYKGLLHSQLRLEPGNAMFEAWQNTPVPLPATMYFYKIENPDGALAGNKVELTEVGPFTLSVTMSKRVVSWSPDHSRITYYTYKLFSYPNGTGIDGEPWDEPITLINPIITTMTTLVADYINNALPFPYLVMPVAMGALGGFFDSHGERLYTNVTPRMLVSGYKIHMFESSLLASLRLFGVNEIKTPESMVNGTFGLLLAQNNSYKGPFEMTTGKGLEPPRQLLTIMNSSMLNKWVPNTKCDEIRGSDGSGFAPFRKKSDNVTMFIKEICRTLELTFVGEVEVEGLTGWKYVISNETFASFKVNPANGCYCKHKQRTDRCFGSGIIDLAGCVGGGPMAFSLPHFYRTRPDLSGLLKGLKPNAAKHEFYIVIEPTLGVPLQMAGRIQLSIRVERNHHIKDFSKIRNAFIPLVRIDQDFSLSAELAFKLKVVLIYGPLIAKIVSYSFAAFFWSVFCYCLYCLCTRNKRSEQNINDTEDPIWFVGEFFRRKFSSENIVEQLVQKSNDELKSLTNEAFEMNHTNGMTEQVKRRKSQERTIKEVGNNVELINSGGDLVSNNAKRNNNYLTQEKS